MIRPVSGNLPKLTGIQTPSVPENNVTIWPNPAEDYINIKTKDVYYGSGSVSVFDLTGHELLNVSSLERLDISSLKKGIYIVVTRIDGKITGYNRLIKSR